MRDNFFTYLKSHKKQLITVGISFFVGAFWIIALRFVTLSSDTVHYHANFAIFVDGERVRFESPTNYEEVQACGGEDFMNPKARVHMHNQVEHVVHVHDAAATWGHFFANIGITNGDKLFRIGDEVYEDDVAGESITFVLNGEVVPTTANRTIESEDVLLISIGDSTPQERQVQYESIEKDAGTYNGKYDPGGCSGGKDFTFWERARQSIGF